MSCRDWQRHIALRGCLIAAAVVALAGEGNAQADATNPTQQPQQQQETSQQPPIIQEQSPESKYYEVNCERPKDHDAADLCEQRRMANAAEETVWWSRLQTWLGGVGFVAVIGSLIFTALAAFAATRQAKIAEVAFTNLERPYVFVFGVHKFSTIDPKGAISAHAPTILYSVANYGKTPAIVENARIIVSINKGHPAIPPRTHDDHNLFTSPVIAGGEVRDFMRETVEDKAIFPNWNKPTPNLREGENLYFRVIINYRGAFTKGHETSACWQYDRNTKSLIQYGHDDYNHVK
jgi:hypothetical protein